MARWHSRDYRACAGILARQREIWRGANEATFALDALVLEFAHMYAEDNPGFVARKFAAACGAVIDCNNSQQNVN